MAVNIHINIETIEGMSTVAGFEKQIQVESFSWGMSQVTSFATSKGGGAGKVNVSDLSIMHMVDKASPKLMLACCTGQHIPKATLTCHKVDGDAGVNFLVIELTDLLVSSVSPAGSNHGDTPMESVTLAFASYKVVYQEQDNKGAKLGGPIEVKFSVQDNKKL